MNFKKYSSDHIFFYFIMFFLFITMGVSFYRFIIKDDYIVYYEGECNPYVESCFKSCEGECTYYKKIEKYASDIYTQCGKDITGCESSNYCLPDDKKCSVIYCDVATDEDCVNITSIVPLLKD